MWLALLLVACLSGPEPADGPRGRVVFASEGGLWVSHSETQGLLTPDTRYWPVPAGTAVAAGTDVVLELGSEGTVAHVHSVGNGPLPDKLGPHSFEGVVVRTDNSRITIDHEAIPGVMAAMVMTFQGPPELVRTVDPGDRVQGRLIGSPHGFRLVDLEPIGVGSAALRTDVEPLEPGDVFPSIDVPIPDGTTVRIGKGADRPTVLTFLYTTCPDPKFCPLLASRLQTLQPKIAGRARIVALTIDPAIDQPHVLKRYARLVEADPKTWVFGRLEPAWLHRAALLSGLAVTERTGRITHNLRVLVLSKDGTLLARYDDSDWPMDAVVDAVLGAEPARAD